MNLFKECALDFLLSRKGREGVSPLFSPIGSSVSRAEEMPIKLTFVLFRIEGDWFALQVKVFSLITTKKRIYKLPLKKKGPILGLVNINGQLLVAVSLKNILSIPEKVSDHQPHISKRVYPRSVVIERGSSKWVFPVEEVWGIESFSEAEFENAPKNSSVEGVSYLKYLIKWKGVRVGVIDDELLFFSLKRQI